jgi:prepilin-type N-terminal cleavage/methylation domain-containing protein
MRHSQSLAAGRTRGFTLLELVVVIAIIVVLTGIVLPVVNKVREQHARARCQSNLMVIMLAAHNYEANHNELPSGVLGPNSKIDGASGPMQQVGMLTLLMPYLGLDDLYKLMYANLPAGHQNYFKREGYFIDEDPGRPFSPWWTMTNSLTGTENSLWRLAQTRVSLFLCPSDNAESRTADTWLSFYTQDTTINSYYCGNGAGASLGRTNYLGNAGAIGGSQSDSFYRQFQGPFYNRSRLTLAQWTAADGTAFTRGICEYLGDGERGGKDWSASWMCGNMVTGWGLALDDPPFSQNMGEPIWLRFGSRHRDIVQFALGDGSVRASRKGAGTTFFTNDWYQLMYASGWRDGWPYDPQVLG